VHFEVALLDQTVVGFSSAAQDVFVRAAAFLLGVAPHQV
jgi:hypothetical protein